jgi:hypothetical protein
MPRISDYGIQGDIYRQLDAFGRSKSLATVAQFFDSNLASGQIENYAWLGVTPSMREWIRERLIHAPQAFNLQIANRKFELTQGMPLDLINNDKTGQAQKWLGNYGAAYKLWISELLAALVNQASTLNSFDSTTFFSASHNYGKTGTFSNLVNSATSGSASAITPLEAANFVNKMIETMKGFPDDQGRIIKNEMMEHVIMVVKAGTVNAASLRVALSNKMLSSGSGMVDNPLQGQGDIKIELITSGLVTTADTKISMFRAPDDNGVPVIFQENKTERMASVISDPNAEYVIKNDAWMVGLKTVGGVGFGLPSDAILGTIVS